MLTRGTRLCSSNKGDSPKDNQADITLYDSLVGTGHIDKAAIISAAGDSTWATSSGFTVSSNSSTPPRHIAGELVSSNRAALADSA